MKKNRRMLFISGWVVFFITGFAMYYLGFCKENPKNGFLVSFAISLGFLISVILLSISASLSSEGDPCRIAFLKNGTYILIKNTLLPGKKNSHSTITKNGGSKILCVEYHPLLQRMSDGGKFQKDDEGISELRK